MSSRPKSSHRMRMRSPQPSQALLNLQKQGLELGVSPPSSTLQVAASHASARSSQSDLDKPLPLEPSKKRRSSSVYSTDTTISNIIHMYGGHRELEDFTLAPVLHHPQAYRDTVAPLLVKRLSMSHSPPPRPTPGAADFRGTVSSLSFRSTGFPTSTLLQGNKTAPSFLEFSRALQNRRNELVSPASGTSSDNHRLAAYDQPAPPSPQVSSVEQSISVSQTPPIPDAMSGTISDIDDSDLLPFPRRLSGSGPPSPMLDDSESRSSIHCPPSIDDHSAGKPMHPSAGGSRSEHWLHDNFVSQSPVSEPSRHDAESTRFQDSLTETEQERTLSYADAKYPGMRKSSFDMVKSQNSSARSSLQQGVSNLLRTLSLSNRGDGKQRHGQEKESCRERQLAIPATPYQVYGAEIWSDKAKKKQKNGGPHNGERGKSFDILSAYQSGQSQFVGVLEGAKRKLGRKTSQKRRRRLKQSIIFVGPTSSGSASEPFAPDNETRWI